MIDRKRYARQYVLLHPEDCDPPHGLDLAPGSRDSIKVDHLTEAFSKSGFDKRKPALVGYPLNGRIQLTTGTHRLEAAKRAGIRLPVRVMLRSHVEAIWGTPEWKKFVEDVSVEELELVEVGHLTSPPGLDERIDIQSAFDYRKGGT